MAVILYRAGTTHTVRGVQCEQELFDEYSYLHNLEMGWFYSPEECYSEEIKEVVEIPIVKSGEAAVNVPVKLKLKEVVIVEESDEDIRARAKKAGLRNWHNMGIEKLKAKLNEA